MTARPQAFHPSWLQAGELLATDLALGSVNRVLASLDRMDSLGAQIDATLADYRSIAPAERDGKAER